MDTERDYSTQAGGGTGTGSWAGTLGADWGGGNGVGFSGGWGAQNYYTGPLFDPATQQTYNYVQGVNYGAIAPGSWAGMGISSLSNGVAPDTAPAPAPVVQEPLAPVAPAVTPAVTPAVPAQPAPQQQPLQAPPGFRSSALDQLPEQAISTPGFRSGAVDRPAVDVQNLDFLDGLMADIGKSLDSSYKGGSTMYGAYEGTERPGVADRGSAYADPNRSVSEVFDRALSPGFAGAFENANANAAPSMGLGAGLENANAGYSDFGGAMGWGIEQANFDPGTYNAPGPDGPPAGYDGGRTQYGDYQGANFGQGIEGANAGYSDFNIGQGIEGANAGYMDGEPGYFGAPGDILQRDTAQEPGYFGAPASEVPTQSPSFGLPTFSQFPGMTPWETMPAQPYSVSPYLEDATPAITQQLSKYDWSPLMTGSLRQMNPREQYQPILDVLKKEVAPTNQYNRVYGNRVQNLTTTPIGQVLESMRQRASQRGTSSATGAYQAMYGTLKEWVGNNKIDLSMPFDEALQDQFAIDKIDERVGKAGGWSKADINKITDQLSQEWAALQSSTGGSRYQGVGLNGRAYVGPDETKQAVRDTIANREFGFTVDNVPLDVEQVAQDTIEDPDTIVGGENSNLGMGGNTAPASGSKGSSLGRTAAETGGKVVGGIAGGILGGAVLGPIGGMIGGGIGGWAGGKLGGGIYDGWGSKPREDMLDSPSPSYDYGNWGSVAASYDTSDGNGLPFTARPAQQVTTTPTAITTTTTPPPSTTPTIPEIDPPGAPSSWSENTYLASHPEVSAAIEDGKWNYGFDFEEAFRRVTGKSYEQAKAQGDTKALAYAERLLGNSPGQPMAAPPQDIPEPYKGMGISSVYGMGPGWNFFPNTTNRRIKTMATGGLVDGPGTETSDDVPAVIDGYQPAALSSGEFVWTGQAVRGAGDGDRMEGARNLHRMMKKFERKAPKVDA